MVFSWFRNVALLCVVSGCVASTTPSTNDALGLAASHRVMDCTGIRVEAGLLDESDIDRILSVDCDAWVQPVVDGKADGSSFWSRPQNVDCLFSFQCDTGLRCLGGFADGRCLPMASEGADCARTEQCFGGTTCREDGQGHSTCRRINQPNGQACVDDTDCFSTSRCRPQLRGSDAETVCSQSGHLGERCLTDAHCEESFVCRPNGVRTGTYCSRLGLRVVLSQGPPANTCGDSCSENQDCAQGLICAFGASNTLGHCAQPGDRVCD